MSIFGSVKIPEFIGTQHLSLQAIDDPRRPGLLGAASQLQAIRLRAMFRMRTPFTDIHAGNVGANGLIFDPSLNPIAHGAAVGGSAAAYSVYDTLSDGD